MFGHTLALGNDWDLHVDQSGNIAVLKGDQAIAQAVANSIRLFKNDAYYDAERGMPHFSMALGIKPLISVLRRRLICAAESVQGVQRAEIENLEVNEREITGKIVLTLKSGAVYDVKI